MKHDQDEENIATAADVRRDKCMSTDCTGQQSIVGAGHGAGPVCH